MAGQSYSVTSGKLFNSWAVVDLNQAAGTTIANLYTGGSGYTLTSVSVTITTVPVTDTPVQLQVFHDPSYDSAPPSIIVGNITIPSDVAAGDVITRNFRYDAKPGERIGVGLLTPASGTGADGAASIIFEGFNYPYPASKDGIAKPGGEGKVYLVES